MITFLKTNRKSERENPITPLRAGLYKKEVEQGYIAPIEWFGKEFFGR